MGDAQQQRVIAEFNRLRQRHQDTYRKIEELSNEVAEHEMVLKTLQPMSADRKCFRLIGDVLVERTVGETVPAVTQHKEKLSAIIQTLVEALKEQEKNVAEYQAKYKIKVVDRQGNPVSAPEEEEAPSTSSGKKPQSQGVLVGAGRQ